MKSKEPLHPGKILKMIMIEDGLCTYNDEGNKEVSVTSVQNELHLNSYTFTKDLLNGNESMDYTIAYKLGSRVKGTDMASWLKLQKDYDDYCEKLSENDSIEQKSEVENFSDSIGINKDLILACVHSTKHWLYHYILDVLDRDDKNYAEIKSAIEEIGTFQDDILKEISK